MYCWDEAKNETNREKHKIGFAFAPRVFAGLVSEAQDTRTTYETRINAFGYVDGRLYACT